MLNVGVMPQEQNPQARDSNVNHSEIYFTFLNLTKTERNTAGGLLKQSGTPQELAKTECSTVGGLLKQSATPQEAC